MGEVTLNPYAYLVDTQGTALDGGLIYIGQPNQDPQATPIALFYDAALTIAAPNPLPTLGGFAVRNGSPALVYAAESSYSLKVVDQIGVQVLSEPSFYGVDARISDAVAALNTDLTTRFEAADTNIRLTADFDRASRIAADDAIIASTSAQDTVLLSLINALANGATRAYLTYAALDAAKATLPVNSFARVTNDPTPANNWLWQWNGTVLTKSDRDELAQALAAVAAEVTARENLISQMTDPEKRGIELTRDGFVTVQILTGLFNVLGLPVLRDVAGVTQVEQNGKVVGKIGTKAEWGGVSFDAGKVELGGTKLSESTTSDGLIIVADGFVLFDSSNVDGGGGTTPAPDETPLDVSKPLFGNIVCGWANDLIRLSVPDLTAHRVEQDKKQPILATVASKTTGYSRSSRDQLVFEPSKLSATSRLILRDTRQSALRTVQDFTVKIAPAGGGQAPKILMFGDSIIHGSHAPDILDPILVAQGYAPVWLGTMTTVGGRKSEAHSGIETTDFTARDISRYDPVPVGGEAAYLASPSPNDFNPCIRLATGGDPVGNVFNGYIFDAAFYQSRFSLATPDVVLIALGTNNIRDRNEPALSTNFYDDMRIMLDSCRAAWPLAQIQITLTPTAASADRDALWSKYVALIEKLKQLIADRADSKLKLIPAWAHVCNEAGYPIGTGTTDTLGAVTAALTDSIHPADSSRAELWQTISAYLASAAKQYV